MTTHIITLTYDIASRHRARLAELAATAGLVVDDDALLGTRPDDRFRCHRWRDSYLSIAPSGITTVDRVNGTFDPDVIDGFLLASTTVDNVREVEIVAALSADTTGRLLAVWEHRR